MKRAMLGVLVVCLLAATLRVDGAWRGDVIYCANGMGEGRISVLEFDFARRIQGRSDGYLDTATDRIEALYHANDVAGEADALFNARAIVMDDADSAIVLCARAWRDEAPQVWLVQAEYRADAPYEQGKGPMNAGASRGNDPLAGGVLTGRLQLPVGPEKGWSASSPARRDLPEIGAAGMFGSDGVMDMARDAAGSLYIAGRCMRTGDGLVFKVPAKGPYPTLGAAAGQRIGEGRFGRAFPLVRKATGKSWFTGVAVDRAGRIHLADRMACTLDLHGADGQPIFSYDMGKELNLVPEAVRIDPLYQGPAVRLVMNVLDTAKPAPSNPTKIVVLDVDAAARQVRLVKRLCDGYLREAGDMGLNAVDSLEISPDGDILYVDSRGENDARVTLITAEDYLKAVVLPYYPSNRVEVTGADVLSPEPGQVRLFGRGMAFVPSPGRQRLARGSDAADPKEVLSWAEAQLAQQSATQPAGAVPSPAADALLDTYCTILGAKCAVGASIEEIRAVCHEAISRAPDASGVGDVISRLAETFEPAERAHYLRNLAQQQATRLAGRLAARLLARDTAASEMAGFRLQDVAVLGSVPCIADEVRGALARYFPGVVNTDARACVNRGVDLMWHDHPAAQDGVLAAMLLECGRPLLSMKQYPQLEMLCQIVSSEEAPEPFQQRGRQLLCQARWAAGDPLGALAAVAPAECRAARGHLLAALSGQKDPARLADLLRKSVDEAVEAARVVGGESADRVGLVRQVAEAAEEMGLWPVAIAGWREVVRLRKATVSSAENGGELGAAWPVGRQADGNVTILWKAHAMLATGQVEEAASELRQLSNVECPALRGQALYDLARARLQQGWLAEAQAYAARCREQLPEAKPVADLQAQIAQAAARQEQRRGHYLRWAELRKAADEAAGPDAAAEALLALAEVEMQLECPRRAAVVLEEALQRHSESKQVPAVLGRLVEVYRDSLGDAAKAEAYRQRQGAAGSGSSQ